VGVASFCIKLFYVQLKVMYITGVMMFYVLLENDIFAEYILHVCKADMSHHNSYCVTYPGMMTKNKIFHCPSIYTTQSHLTVCTFFLRIV